MRRDEAVRDAERLAKLSPSARTALVRALAKLAFEAEREREERRERRRMDR